MNLEEPINIREFLRSFKEWKRERARTKKPSLLDRVGIKDFPIPEELKKKNVPKKDPNVISEEKIGDYEVGVHRLDYDDGAHDYFIFYSEGNEPFTEMLKEDDFEQAARTYLNVLNYSRRQPNLSGGSK